MNNTTDKWYKKGLQFSCRQCGNCCSGPQEGYVWANHDQIKAMAQFLGISAKQFQRKYTHRVGLRYSLIEKKVGKDCIFLTETGKGKICVVYPVRPDQCRNWPFWKENLRSQSAWQEAGLKCPGINQGRWHSEELIELIAAGEVSTQEAAGTNTKETAIKWIQTHQDHKECLQAVAEIYDKIDSYIRPINPQCDNCGRCCDFTNFDHRLYATTLEMLYFWQGLKKSQTEAASSRKKVKFDASRGRCPYQQGKGCQARDFRLASCRIFYCRDQQNSWQSELSEQVLGQLRKLHEQYQAIYYYDELLNWLARWEIADSQR